MSSNVKTALRSSVGFLLAAVFLFVAFRGTKFDALWQSLKEVHYLWVLLLVPVGLASHYVRALRWKYLIGHVKENLSTRNLFSAVMIGYMVNNVLPRVGELIRPYVAGKLEGISKSAALGSVVIERIIDMITFFFILCLVLFLYPNSLDAFWENADSFRLLFLAGSILSLLIFVVIFLKSESIFQLVRYIKPIVPARYRNNVDSLLESFLSGFRVATQREKFLSIVALSLVIWFLYGLGLYVPFFAFESLANLHLGFSASIILLTVTSIAFVLPAPGAFGTYHSFLKFSLMKLYGADEVTALSYSIVTHEVGYISIMIVGIYYFLRDHMKVSDVTTSTRNRAEASMTDER